MEAQTTQQQNGGTARVVQVDEYERAKVEALLIGYDARYADGMSQFQVLAVEAEFQAPLVNPDTRAPSQTWMLGGKLDVLVHELATRRNGQVEHKHTTSDAGAGSDYIKRLRLDGQVSLYYAGAEALGTPIDFCLYDVLVKPSQRPYKATPLENRKYTKDGALYKTQRERDETPGEYRARCLEAIAEAPNETFIRGEVVRIGDEMSDAMRDVWQLAKQLREAELAGRFPRNPDACVRYGRTCEYFSVCTGEASLENEELFRRSVTPHPELETTIDRRLLTTSRLSAARACQRLHKFKYVDLIRPRVDSETLRFGQLIHLGLEAWWKAKDGERLEAALAAVRPANVFAAPAEVA